MATYECVECGVVTEYEPLMVETREVFRPRLCVACQAAEKKRNADFAAAQREVTLAEEWLRICPDAYRATDPRHPDMNQAVLAGILRWELNAAGRGIGLWSTESGLRKTRMLFLLLKRLHFDGVRVCAVSFKRLSMMYAKMFTDSPEGDAARQMVKRTLSAQVLLLDDLDKAVFTPRVEGEFWDLVEYRTSHLKPILWTANVPCEGLQGMMSEERGSTIVRRLDEFTEVMGL